MRPCQSGLYLTSHVLCQKHAPCCNLAITVHHCLAYCLELIKLHLYVLQEQFPTADARKNF